MRGKMEWYDQLRMHLASMEDGDCRPVHNIQTAEFITMFVVKVRTFNTS